MANEYHTCFINSSTTLLHFTFSCAKRAFTVITIKVDNFLTGNKIKSGIQITKTKFARYHKFQVYNKLEISLNSGSMIKKKKKKYNDHAITWLTWRPRALWNCWWSSPIAGTKNKYRYLSYLQHEIYRHPSQYTEVCIYP
jgi:hypothetical protein